MTSDTVRTAVGGLVFVGSAGGPTKTATDIEDAAHIEAARIAARLGAHERDPSSVIALDVLHEPGPSERDIEAALSAALPRACSPCLTFIEVSRGSLDGRRLAVQAVSTADPVTSSDERFPQVNTAGPIVAVAAQVVPSADDMVAQTNAVMRALGERLREAGTTYDDVVRCDVFYADQASTHESWEVNARERAKYFAEPGPATTGIPLPRVQNDALISIRALAVRGARELGLRRHSWPEGHWDWPIHLPYKHGCDCAGTTFVGGQVSLDETAAVIDPDDLARQTRRAVDNILRVLALVEKGRDDVLRLVAFYQHRDADSVATVQACAREQLGDRDVELSLVGLPSLAYEHMIVEIEAEAR